MEQKRSNIGDLPPPRGAAGRAAEHCPQHLHLVCRAWRGLLQDPATIAEWLLAVVATGPPAQAAAARQTGTEAAAQ